MFIGHAYRTIIGWVGVSITGIKEIKAFLGEIQPSLLIKIFCMILANGILKFSLKIGDDFMEGFGGWCKIIRVIYPLFVEIYMNMRIPFIVLNDAFLAFNLG